MPAEDQQGEDVEGFPFRDVVAGDEGELSVGEGGFRSHRDAAAFLADVHAGEEDGAGEGFHFPAVCADFHGEGAHGEPRLDREKQVDEVPEAELVEPAFLVGGEGFLADDRVKADAGADAEDVVFISRNGDGAEVNLTGFGAREDPPKSGFGLRVAPETVGEVVAGAGGDDREADL